MLLRPVAIPTLLEAEARRRLGGPMASDTEGGLKVRKSDAA